LRVHAQQGGLCLLLGEPGTGKSVLKQALVNHDPKRMITPVVNRTLHTYHNTLRILCQAFQIEFEGHDHRCERLLVQEAFKIHRAGKMLVPIIDDAHLMPTECLRKLRLLCEDFPHSHNLVLIGQAPLLQSLALSINEEIRSRVTYSVVLPRLAPEIIEQFVLGEASDRVARVVSAPGSNCLRSCKFPPFRVAFNSQQLSVERGFEFYGF
jgi:MSHA biogenesis protein MshM